MNIWWKRRTVVVKKSRVYNTNSEHAYSYTFSASIFIASQKSRTSTAVTHPAPRIYQKHQDSARVRPRLKSKHPHTTPSVTTEYKSFNLTYTCMCKCLFFAHHALVETELELLVPSCHVYRSVVFMM